MECTLPIAMAEHVKYSTILAVGQACVHACAYMCIATPCFNLTLMSHAQQKAATPQSLKTYLNGLSPSLDANTVQDICWFLFFQSRMRARTYGVGNPLTNPCPPRPTATGPHGRPGEGRRRCSQGVGAVLPASALLAEQKSKCLLRARLLAS
jgi:hypothetical protein